MYIGKSATIALIRSKMISERFLKILRCPLHHGQLHVAADELVARLNSRISAGQLVNQGGGQVDRQLQSALLDPAELRAYPIRDEIPCLLIDEAILLDQFGQQPPE